MGFGGYLQANTAVDVLIGPFVDDTDGKTAETGLTIDVEVSKNGQALANKSDATAPVHDAAGDIDGYYNCELDATDTNTEGTLTLVCFAAGSLPVRHDFMVLAQAAYISMVTAKDTGFMDVNVKAISEDTTAADNCELDYDGTGYAGGTIKKESDMVSIHGTALTETATQLAGAFTKFFNVASPTGTVNSIPDAVAGAANGLMISGTNAGTTTLGALTVTGACTHGSTVLGNTTAGTITQTGAASWGATTIASLAITGAASVGTTTTLTGAVSTGAVTLNGLAITNALSVGTTTTLTGNVSLSGTLGVVGATTLASLSITGQLDVGNLLVDGTTVLTGTVGTGAFTFASITSTGAITGNIVGNITGTIDTVTTLTNKTGFALAAGALGITHIAEIDRIYQMLNNPMIVTEATGAVALRNVADGADIATGTVADLGATTKRNGLTWA